MYHRNTNSEKWKPTVIPTSMQIFDPIPQLNNSDNNKHG
jgi:hypothetical protein